MFSKLVFVVATAFALCGCATHAWIPGPNARGTFEEARGHCQLMANNTGGGFYAAGSPEFVAGASAGAAIGQAVKAQNNFNSCMSATGWQPIEQKLNGKNASLTEVKAAVKALQDEAAACASNTRSNPKYSLVVGHFSDPKVGRYSITQMANEGVPTAEEAAIIVAFQDEVQACRTQYADKLTELNPPLGNRFKEQARAATEVLLLLATRRISWGEYARRIQAIADNQSST